MASKGTNLSSAVRAMDKLQTKPRIQVICSKCAVWSCENNNKPSDNVTYYNLPTADKGRCIIWLLNAGRIDLVKLTSHALSRYVFCETHFETSQFVKKGPNIRKLAKNAIPTLFGIVPALIPLHLINPSLATEPPVEPNFPFKSSSKPSSISAANAKCYKCSKSYKNSSDITLYFFPVDDVSRYFSWIINSGESHLLQISKEWVHHNCLLCSDHFESSQFESDNPTYLRAGAIPTLFRGLVKPTIPAPTKFDKDCKKPFPLLIKSSNSSAMAPKVSIVKTANTTNAGKSPAVPFKVNVPKINIGSVAKSSIISDNDDNSSLSIKENPSTMRTYKRILSKPPTQPEPAKTVDVKSKVTPMPATIFIDATGKTASNHPLANVISTFLAQNKGHTGDLLITDGTPNGVKYLIRQNKPNTPAEATSISSGDSPSIFVSPQVSTSGPTIVRSSIKSLSGTEKTSFIEQASSVSTVTSKPATGVLVSSTISKSSGSSESSTPLKVVVGKTSITAVPSVKLPTETKSSTPGSPTSVKALGNKSVTTVTSDAGGSATKSTADTKASSVEAVNQTKVDSSASKSPASNNPQASDNTGQQPFTIVQKNVESIKQNGSTTCKSTFVIRGNGPLSPAQLEDIIKDNLLKNGTIKDGAKILIRHKGGAPPSATQSPDVLKNEAFVVKQSKIVPIDTSVKKVNLNGTSTTTVAGASKSPTATNSSHRKMVIPKPAPKLLGSSPTAKMPGPSLAPKPLFKSFSLNQEIPMFRYPKGISPEKMNELRREIRKHRVKINRQAKVIERLKREKKEQIKHIPLNHLSKLVKEHLPGFCGTFFQSQLLTISKDSKKHGHRWDDDTKVFALGLWNRSPAAFKLMQRAFNMPSMNTLSKWVTSVPPEIDFFERLKEVVTKPVEEPEDPFNDLGFLEEPKDDDGGKPVISEVPDSEKHAVPEESLHIEDAVEVMEMEMEPEGPHDGEPLYPDEQEPMEASSNDKNEEEAIIEKVCIDLDAESGMHVVEEVVDSSSVLVQQLIVAAENSSAPVILQT